MKKNVASQIVQCQVTTAADGTPFTGSVTVSVTGDGGTRATGSVGSGAATHEGGGLHSYAPATAETNYDHVSFQFAGTGAITSAVHFTTTFPQTVDNATDLATLTGRLTSTRAGYLDNLSAGAVATAAALTTVDDFLDTEIAAIISTQAAHTSTLSGLALSTQVDALEAAATAIEADTQDIQSRLPATLVSGRIDASAGALAANVITAASIAADAGAELADAVWDEAIAGHLTAGSVGEALSNAGAAGTPPTAAAIADAVWDEALSGHVAAGSAGEALSGASAPSAGTVATAVWAAVSEAAETYGDQLRLMAAALVGKATVQDDDGSYAFRDAADSKNRIAGTRTATARTVATRDGT